MLQLAHSLLDTNLIHNPPTPKIKYHFKQPMLFPFVHKTPSYQEVEDAAKFISTYQDPHRKKVGVIDFTGLLHFFLLKLNQPRKIKVKKIPHMAEYCQGVSKKGYLLSASLPGTDKEVCIFSFDESQRDHIKNPMDCEWSFAARLIGQLKITNVVFIVPFIHSLSDSSESTIYFLKDHVNFLGKTGTIGHNEEKWGPRFFDMSGTYPNHLRTLFKEQLDKKAIPSEEVTDFYSLNQSLLTKADLQFITNLKLSVTTSFGVPEAGIMTHMRIPVLFTGFNSALFNLSTSESPFTIRDVIASATLEFLSDPRVV